MKGVDEMDFVTEYWNKLDAKLSRTAVASYDKIPYTTENGVHNDMMKKNKAWWTNGFWPALMVLMYAGTKKEQYLKTARHSMELMDSALYTYNGLHHDVGFMWNISAGTDYRITGDQDERNRFMIAANYMMGRFNCDGEFFRAWNGSNTEGWAIIDCMMNLPLLYRATEEIGDPRFAMAAIKHADKTMKYHVRPDGSCNHINEYDHITGEFIQAHTGQGVAPDSSWSRGQAWGLYGFALSYRYTKKSEYLATAKRIAHYFITNVQSTGWLSLCDFRQPAEPVIYDSTAAACAACGLLEIEQHVPECEKKIYHDAAVNMLKALDERFCDWSDDEDSILQSGTGSYNSEIHIPIIYGDYFFAEGIYRLMGFDAGLLW